MRIHVPEPRPRETGDFQVHVNPGSENREPFAMIALDETGQTEICLDSLDDAERLVRAAAKALHQLKTSIKGEPHKWVSSDFQYCDECGQGARAKIHAEPAPVITGSERTCDQASPVTGAWCHLGGDHTTHRDTDGGTWTTDARLTELAAKS